MKTLYHIANASGLIALVLLVVSFALVAAQIRLGIRLIQAVPLFGACFLFIHALLLSVRFGGELWRGFGPWRE